jgi:hypothetical protein
MWEDNINVDLKGIKMDVANWHELAQDRGQWRTFVNMILKLLIP